MVEVQQDLFRATVIFTMIYIYIIHSILQYILYMYDFSEMGIVKLMNLRVFREMFESLSRGSHILPRFTGFHQRVILDEAREVKENSWQQSARRAGWQPRAEAAVESAGTSVTDLYL